MRGNTLKLRTEHLENIASLYDILTDNGGGREISWVTSFTDKLTNEKLDKIINMDMINVYIFIFNTPLILLL